MDIVTVRHHCGSQTLMLIPENGTLELARVQNCHDMLPQDLLAIKAVIAGTYNKPAAFKIPDEKYRLFLVLNKTHVMNYLSTEQERTTFTEKVRESYETNEEIIAKRKASILDHYGKSWSELMLDV